MLIIISFNQTWVSILRKPKDAVSLNPKRLVRPSSSRILVFCGGSLTIAFTSCLPWVPAGSSAFRRRFRTPTSKCFSRTGDDGGVSSAHYGSKQGDIETLNYTLSHERGSERSERASKKVSTAERASEVSRAEQANE